MQRIMVEASLEIEPVGYTEEELEFRRECDEIAADPDKELWFTPEIPG